jgi:hypothetical protein
MAAGTDTPLVRRAIAYYQSAANDFSKGLLAWKPQDQGALTEQ